MNSSKTKGFFAFDSAHTLQCDRFSLMTTVCLIKKNFLLAFLCQTTHINHADLLNEGQMTNSMKTE